MKNDFALYFLPISKILSLDDSLIFLVLSFILLVFPKSFLKFLNNKLFILFKS